MKKVVFNLFLALFFIIFLSFSIKAQHSTFVTIKVYDTNDNSGEDEIYLKIWIEGQTEPIVTDVKEMGLVKNYEYNAFEIKQNPVKITKIDVWEQDGSFLDSDDRLNGCENGTDRPCTEREKIKANWEDSEYEMWWHVGPKGFGL